MLRLSLQCFMINSLSYALVILAKNNSERVDNYAAYFISTELKESNFYFVDLVNILFFLEKKL